MTMRVAIVGAGAGGSYAAWRLAANGFAVDLFESRPERDKACGGGVTGRAFELVPELSELSVDYLAARELRLVTPFGSQTSAALDPPVRIYNRGEFDGALREKAESAGTRLHVRRVREIARTDRGWLIDGEHRADFLIGAGGAACPVGRMLRGKIPSAEMMPATGYFVPGAFDPVIHVKFFLNLRGYLWWFPRRDRASLGIVWDAGRMTLARARELCARWLAENFPSVRIEHCTPYSAPCPCYPKNTFYGRAYQGDGVALIGDAAGLCDPVTGEGIRHALHSAKLLADALITGEPRRYYPALCREILPELEGSARAREVFYTNWFLQTGFGLSRRSRTLREIISRHAVGGVGTNESMRAIIANAGRVLIEIARGERQP